MKVFSFDDGGNLVIVVEGASQNEKVQIERDLNATRISDSGMLPPPSLKCNGEQGHSPASTEPEPAGTLSQDSGPGTAAEFMPDTIASALLQSGDNALFYYLPLLKEGKIKDRQAVSMLKEAAVQRLAVTGVAEFSTMTEDERKKFLHACVFKKDLEGFNAYAEQKGIRKTQIELIKYLSAKYKERRN